jgi:hypothetical protein
LIRLKTLTFFNKTEFWSSAGRFHVRRPAMALVEVRSIRKSSALHARTG